MVSADSHPVSGGFVFSVGSEAGAPAASVAELLGDQQAGPVTSVAFGVARAVEYAAIALGLGVLAVLLLVWLPGLRSAAGADDAWSAAAAGFARRARGLLVIAGVAGSLAALAALPLQTATAEGGSLWSALGGTREVLDTRFGVVWGLGAIAWAFVAALAALRPLALPALRPASVGAAGIALPGPGKWTAVLAAPLLALAFLPGLGGHAGVQDPVAVLLPANVLHVLAAGAWIGGLATLVVALPSATRRLEPVDRTRLLAATLTRFSTLALIAVAALLLGGIVQSLLELGAVDDLWDTRVRPRDRDQGRARARAAGTRRAQPAPHRAGAPARGARRTIAGRGGRPACGARCAPRSRSAPPRWPSPVRWRGTRRRRRRPPGPFSGSADLGPARAELTVEPARAGANEIHVYLLDRSDGRQYGAPKELRFEASLPDRAIAPITLDARKAGPGHYVVGAAPLAPAGDWRLELVARISDFDELRTTYTVPIE